MIRKLSTSVIASSITRALSVTAIVLLLMVLFPASVVRGDLIIDHFEDQAVASGTGTPQNYFSFGGQLADRGVTNLLGATSGDRSAFYAIDFDQTGFGVGAARQGLALSLSSQSVLRVNLRMFGGDLNSFVGFRVTDVDGTILRTGDDQLFSVSGNFQTISQALPAITWVDEVGATPGLDWSNINSIGLLFFDRGFTGTRTMVFDDLRISTVPEPSAISLLMMAIFGIAARRRRLRG